MGISYILKEQFHKFWEYNSPTWAGNFMDNTCELAIEANLEPMTKITEMLQRHRGLILNYFRVKKKLTVELLRGLIVK